MSITVNRKAGPVESITVGEGTQRKLTIRRSYHIIFEMTGFHPQANLYIPVEELPALIEGLQGLL